MGHLSNIIIGLDFDGTCVKHAYPKLGEEAPHCVETLLKILEEGGKIVLNTMRAGPGLLEAVTWLESRGITLYGVNNNPDQRAWTLSPKVYAHIYIDDAALGAPLISDSSSHRPYIDWLVVDEWLFGKDSHYLEKIVP